MVSYWTSLFASLFPPTNQEEAIRREHARVDYLIAERKLQMKSLRKKVKEKKKEKFRKKMENVPARVTMVHIEGLGKTPDQLVMSKIGNLFNVNTFEDIINNTKEVHKNLRTLGCFEAVNIEVDTLPDSAGVLYQVNIRVEERGSVYGHLGLSVPTTSQHSVGGLLKLGLANLWGRGQRLEAGIESGGPASSLSGPTMASLALLNPIHSLTEGSVVSTFLRMSKNHLKHLSSEVESVSPGASLTLWPTPYLCLTSECVLSWFHSQYKGCKPTPFGPCTSYWDPAIETAGHLVRGSLKSQASLDTRDCTLLPSAGLFLKAEHKIMGGQGGHNIMKSFEGHNVMGVQGRSTSLISSESVGQQVEVTASLHLPVPYMPKITSSCRLIFSQMWGCVIPQETPLVRTPQCPSPHPLHPLDHLQASSQTLNSPNPPYPSQSSSTVLFLFSLSSPLPLLADNSMLGRHLRLQAFLTGQANPAGEGQPPYNWNFLSNSLGLGIIGKAWDVGRAELNYCFPIGGSNVKPGLRFSFGAEFL